jgi:hypothetical protein
MDTEQTNRDKWEACIRRCAANAKELNVLTLSYKSILAATLHRLKGTEKATFIEKLAQGDEEVLKVEAQMLEMKRRVQADKAMLKLYAAEDNNIRANRKIEAGITR